MNLLQVLLEKISQFSEIGNNVMFYNIKLAKDKFIPFLIAWLIFWSVYFMFKIKFINVKYFFKSIKWCFSEKYAHNKHSISPKKIVLTTIGSAVDLGSVFGVALGVTIGGPGVIFWLIVAGFMSTSIRFMEVFAAHRYRVFKQHRSQGGPYVYIEKIFANLRLKKLGKIVALIFAINFTFSTLFSLQINQTVELISNHTFNLSKYRFLICIAFSSLIILTIKSGISRVTKVSEKIVPIMTISYFLCTAIVIFYNIDNLIPSIKLIFNDAMSFKKINNNALGCMIIGIQRAFFCNEAGMGSAAIAHATSQNEDTLIESIISMVCPIISVLVVCLCSGLVVVITNTHTHELKTGIEIILHSFTSVNQSLKIAVFLIVPVFGFTTAIAWGYCGNRTWCYIFGEKYSNVYYVVLFTGYIICGMIEDFSVILNIADFMNLSITIPNIIALFFISFRVKKTINRKINID